MFTSLLDAVVQAMGEHYTPNQVWLAVKILVPFLLLCPAVLIAWSVVGRLIRKHRRSSGLQAN